MSYQREVASEEWKWGKEKSVTELTLDLTMETSILMIIRMGLDRKKCANTKRKGGYRNTKKNSSKDF